MNADCPTTTKCGRHSDRNHSRCCCHLRHDSRRRRRRHRRCRHERHSRSRHDESRRKADGRYRSPAPSRRSSELQSAADQPLVNGAPTERRTCPRVHVSTCPRTGCLPSSSIRQEPGTTLQSHTTGVSGSNGTSPSVEFIKPEPVDDFCDARAHTAGDRSNCQLSQSFQSSTAHANNATNVHNSLSVFSGRPILLSVVCRVVPLEPVGGRSLPVDPRLHRQRHAATNRSSSNSVDKVDVAHPSQVTNINRRRFVTSLRPFIVYCEYISRSKKNFYKLIQKVVKESHVVPLLRTE